MSAVIIDARLRFTIARAAAIAKRSGWVNEGLGLGVAQFQEWEIELVHCMKTGEGFEPAHDDDGRPIER